MRDVIVAAVARHDHDRVATHLVPFVGNSLKDQSLSFNLCSNIWTKDLDVHHPSLMPAAETVYKRRPFTSWNLPCLHVISFRDAGRARICHIELLAFRNSQRSRNRNPGVANTINAQPPMRFLKMYP